MLRKTHIPVMMLLFLAAALVEAVRLTSLSAITNGDLWWHLSSGLWILQNHALPHNGIYSQADTQPWTAVSWAYDVLLAVLYRAMDLRAVPALLMFFKVGLAAVTFVLAGGLRGKFWSAVILSGLAQYVLGGMQPSPAYFSIIFFGIELLLIFESRERPGALYWLAPLFLVWANLDNQFGYGIGLMVVFMAVALSPALKRWATSGRSSGAQESGNADFATQGNESGSTRASYGGNSLFVSLAATAAAVVASLIAPSFYRPYATFVASIAGPAHAYLPDFKAMSFHQPQDYLLLLLTMAAFLALGRRQSRDPFQIILLCLASMVSFYAQRNVWIVVLVAIAIIAETIAADTIQVRSRVSGLRSQEQPVQLNATRLWNGLGLAGIVTCALVGMILWVIPRQRDALLAKVAEGYPVAASNYIRDHRLPRPLFNAYEWGGFLTWYLPQYPVAVDSRTDLYGDDFVILYSKAMNADVPYTAFPAMAEARTLVFPKKSVLGEALSTVAGFKVAYSDDVGLVLTREDDAVAGK